MRRVVNYQLRKESFQDMTDAGRYNRCIEITFHDKAGVHTHKLGAGSSDEIDIYREHSETFVLSRNRRLGYVGLQVFKGSDQVGDIFIEPHQVDDTVGDIELAAYTIIRRLLDYI